MFTLLVEKQFKIFIALCQCTDHQGQFQHLVYRSIYFVASCRSTKSFVIRLICCTNPFCRAVLCKRGLCRHAVSVCLSVRPSVTFVNSVKTSFIFKLFSPRIARPFQFLHTKCNGNIQMGIQTKESQNAGGVGTNRDSTQIDGYRTLRPGFC